MPITLDGTSGITTPGLINTGSETVINLTTSGNTILGDASTDTLNVGNGGLVKDASGNVGIGTASPAISGSVFTILNVKGVSNTTALITATSGDLASSVQLYSGASTSDNPAIGYQKALRFGSTTDSGIGGFTERMRLDSSGNLTVTGGATIQGLTVGWGSGSITTNTALGISALLANTTGYSNTALGWNALIANTTGFRNTAVGKQALGALTTGDNNTAIGEFALLTATTAQYNTAVGQSALRLNTTASNNTAVGFESAYSTTTGEVTAIGTKALYANTTGDANTAVGYVALTANTTGANNTGIGRNAVRLNTTGSFNTGLGSGALYNNTTASNNTAVGYQAGYTNTGTQGVFIGGQAGYATTTANGSTHVGYLAGYSVTTGSYNALLGQGAGYYITTGAKNTIVGGYNGNQGGLDIRTASNYIVLSDGDGNPAFIRTASDSIYVGLGTLTQSGNFVLQGYATSGWGPVIAGVTGAYGSSTTQWYLGSNSNIKGGTTYNTFTVTAGGPSGGVNLTSGATAWTSASDSRLKDVTGTYENALADIVKLQPVKFTWKSDADKKPQVGVLAQSVEGVVPEAIDYIRVDKEDETDYLGVRYTELIPLLVAAIKELKAEIDLLKGVK